MATFSQQNLSLYGVFYLPLAVLTGLSLSAILPAALSFLIPAVESALFTLLPHLWNAFLSWVTPPCLFVLLNGIIVVLTACSGVLSSSEANDGSDFSAHLLRKMKNLPKASLGSLVADASASPALLNMKSVSVQSSEASMEDSYLARSSQQDLDVHPGMKSMETHNSVSIQTMLHVETLSAHGILESEVQWNTEDDDELPSSLSSLAMVSRSFDSHVPLDTNIWEEDEEEEEEEEGGGEEQEKDEKISALPKLDVVHKGFSSGYRSEPSSPQFATMVRGNPIKRALSIDSASFQEELYTGSPEDLSDEAFKKRVEAFISRMNAQLRTEAK